ncbi:hypothetical protein BU23DRAFT_331943 [Bimuria novae-zelandiae CBS 107.79]|uniref:Uncharacterized protein n=1 Tax=Bimuria novae-zelandiae CBS 107.79 TaxID=1447943 RepID=A0A6A5UNB9_9PLEO|nr:hypothetical protein BU23DRAFT_331943 [Bimuria novae-zelandiae CBS 107.79]
MRRKSSLRWSEDSTFIACFRWIGFAKNDLHVSSHPGNVGRRLDSRGPSISYLSRRPWWLRRILVVLVYCYASINKIFKCEPSVLRTSDSH